MSVVIGIVYIIGAPVACAQGIKESWREVAAWTEAQLAQRFGSAVQVQYFDLFDPDCPPMPENAQLPLVIVNDQVVSMGGKVSIPAIRKKLEELGLQRIRS